MHAKSSTLFPKKRKTEVALGLNVRLSSVFTKTSPKRHQLVKPIN